MQIKADYIKKKDVKYCPSTYSIKEALQLIKETGYRCIPVVDEKENTYLGQIYKADLLEYVFEKQEDVSENVIKIAKEKNSYLYENTTVASAIFNIESVPFFAVLDEKDKFKGIITHAVIINLFRDGFGIKTGGYCLTIALPEQKGMLKKLFILLKDFNIEGLHTFDNGDKLIRRVTVTISTDSPFDPKVMEEKLRKIGCRLVDVEEIKQIKNAK